MVSKKEFDLIIEGAKLRFFSEERDPQLPTILFLHESFGCIRHWRSFPGNLGEYTGCNVLVYDRQGYGMSDPFMSNKRTSDYLEKEADVLHKIVETLDLKNLVLFGHSDGGTIALLAAAKYPQHIKAVVTEGAHLFVEEITLEGIRTAENLYDNSNLKEKLAYYHGDKTEQVFRLWADTWSNEEYRDWNIEHRLMDITCPVLVIQGKNDEYGSIRQVESIENNTSGKCYRFMPEAGHTPHREVQSEVLDAVKGFLEKVYNPSLVY